MTTSNLTARISALVEVASPEMLSDLAAALWAIAEAHPGSAGQYVGSIAAEMRSLALERNTTGVVK